MNRFDHQWQKLTALARQAPADSAAEAPPGFATRVATRGAASAIPGRWAGLERLALRGFVAATACCVATIAFNFFVTSPDLPDDTDLAESVTAVLDLS